MKPAVSTEARQRVLELRPRHSFREVAERMSAAVLFFAASLKSVRGRNMKP